MRIVRDASRVPVGTFNNKYIALNTISGQVLCDPTDKFEAEQIAKELNCKNYEIVEYKEPAKSNIDYSVLDQY